MRPERVRFQGEEYWLDGDLICPLDHLDAEGNYLGDAYDISFAIVRGDQILRHGFVIGQTSELYPVNGTIEVDRV
jgi:hypothetical protein